MTQEERKLNKNLMAGRSKRLQVRLTDREFATVSDSANRTGMNLSDYARKIMLAAAVRDGKPDDSEALVAVRTFQRIFCEAMELNLAGKLTVARFQAMVARRTA